MRTTLFIAANLLLLLPAQWVLGQTAPPAPRPGVKTAGVRRQMSAITPLAIFPVGGNPDWQVITPQGVWVANAPRNSIHRLDAKTNKITAEIAVGGNPCSGLAAGFGSIWVPSCNDKSLARVDIRTNKVTATLPIGPAESEGGIAASPAAVWLVTDPKGVLSKIDPVTNKVAATFTIPAGSASVLYAKGAIWVTTPAKNLLTRVDIATGKTESISVGPGPRFQTAGAGSVWTLNQGDGTVSRVDIRTRRVIATISCGIAGGGGELAFGEGHVWATVFTVPITMIDPSTNKVVKQWVGPGGDSIRVAKGSVWLCNLREHNVVRIAFSKL